jgi:hypothetical protein
MRRFANLPKPLAGLAFSTFCQLATRLRLSHLTPSVVDHAVNHAGKSRRRNRTAEKNRRNRISFASRGRGGTFAVNALKRSGLYAPKLGTDRFSIGEQSITREFKARD